jgi:hypothetical protein
MKSLRLISHPWGVRSVSNTYLKQKQIPVSQLVIINDFRLPLWPIIHVNSGLFKCVDMGDIGAHIHTV